MASPSTISILRILLLICLPILSLLGLYNTFYTARLNGTGRLISSILNSGDAARFPGTSDPLLRSYTRIKVLDETITLLVTFFAPVVDGSLDGYSRWALGQFGAAWAVLVLEGLRIQNEGRIVSWTGTFGLTLQFLSFTIVTPIYLFIHLLTSPAASPSSAQDALLVHSEHLSLLPLTIGLSYILPSLGMGLEPPSVSVITHQRLIAFWQFFPVLTTLAHLLLTRLAIPFITGTTPNINRKQVRPTATQSEYMAKSRIVHIILLVFCVSTHLPSITSDFQRRFVPFSLVHGPSTTVPDLATGVKNFLQWDIYIGCVALLVWSAFLYYQARTSTMNAGKHLADGVADLSAVVTLALVAGPMGVVIWLLRERDRYVLKEAETVGDGKKQK